MTRFLSLFLLMISAHTTANAVMIDTIGDAFTIQFNGRIEEMVQPGLSAQAHFKVTDFAHKADIDRTLLELAVDLKNTSSSPITASRVSILGFDTSGIIDFELSSVEGVFDFVSSGQMSDIGKLNLCFKDTDGENCSGGASGGVDIGAPRRFVAELFFEGNITSISLDNFGVRYQDIVGGTVGDGDSGTGVGTVVPLPAAVWLFGSGLLALFGLRRFKLGDGFPAFRGRVANPVGA